MTWKQKMMPTQTALERGIKLHENVEKYIDAHKIFTQEGIYEYLIQRGHHNV